MKKTSGPSSSTKCRLLESFWTFWPAFQRFAEAQMSEKKLTPQRTRILACLNERGPQIMSDLKKELGVTATNITALIDALERDGLVARKPHPKDRRATVIEITEKAACEMAQGCSAYRERVSEIFTALSETERQELLRMMDILKAQLNQTTA